ncbi:MAG: hypothetical protein NTZ92_04875 [Candidatus Omnitrophica bacterium]|nr:hypothetical protein [Candidatus Omnitrophota bacterium]
MILQGKIKGELLRKISFEEAFLGLSEGIAQLSLRPVKSASKHFFARYALNVFRRVYVYAYAYRAANKRWLRPYIESSFQKALLGLSEGIVQLVLGSTKSADKHFFARCALNMIRRVYTFAYRAANKHWLRTCINFS